MKPASQMAHQLGMASLKADLAALQISQQSPQGICSAHSLSKIKASPPVTPKIQSSDWRLESAARLRQLP